MKSVGFCLQPTCLVLCCGCGRSPEPRTIVIRAPGSLEVTHATDRVQITDGPERKIEITEDEHGIDVTVTIIHLAADAKGNVDYKDGEHVTKKYKDAAELEKQSPDLYRFYKDYAGSLGTAVLIVAGVGFVQIPRQASEEAVKRVTPVAEAAAKAEADPDG